DFRVFGGGKDLVVRANGGGLFRAVEAALGLVDVVGQQRGANILHAEAEIGKRGGVDADAHGGLLIAFDGDQADAGNFTQFLRKDRVGEVVDLFERQRVRADFQRENRGVSGIHLAVGGRIRRLGEIPTRGVHGGLDVLGGGVNVPVEYELKGDAGVRKGTDGGHLRQPADLPELHLQRRGDGRGHDVRTRAGILGGHLDGRKINGRQRRDGQQQITQQAHQDDARHEQRGRDGTADERFGDVHGLVASSGAELVGRPFPPLRATLTFEPFCNLYWPSTTTVWPACRPLSMRALVPSVWATEMVCCLTVRFVPSPSTRKAYSPSGPRCTTGDGTTRPFLRVVSNRRTLPNCPGHSLRSVFGKVAFNRMVAVETSIWLSITASWPSLMTVELSRATANTLKSDGARPRLNCWRICERSCSGRVKTTEMGLSCVIITRPLVSAACTMLPASTLRMPVRPSRG